MSEINWPDNPTIGEIYESPSGGRWQWNGYAWDALSSVITLWEQDGDDIRTKIQSDSPVIAPNILPYFNDTQDIGSADRRWKDIYLGSKINFVNKLDFEKLSENIMDINETGITLRKGKTYNIEETSEFFGVVESVNITGFFKPGPSPYLLKVGDNIYKSVYSEDIFVYDTDLDLQTQFTVSSYGLVYNSNLNRIYIGDWESSNNSYYLDLDTNSLVTVSSGNPGASRDILTYNSFADRIFAYNYYSPESIDIYDADYVYIGSVSMPSGFRGYGITSNQINGKVYVQDNPMTLSDARILIYQYDSTGDTLNLIEDITIPGLFTGSYNSPGSAYDADRNRAYIAVDNSLVIIDGDTDQIVNVVDVSDFIFGVVSVYYNQDRIILSGYDNTGFISYVLNVDPDTLGVSLVYEYDNNPNFATYTFAIYDGVDYYVGGVQTDKIEKITGDPVITESVTSITTEDISEDVTHVLQSKSGTLAHLDDIPTDPENTWDMTRVAFVRPSVDGGNNSTGVVGDGNKPFATITFAQTQPNVELVYILPGTHTGSHQILSDITYYCAPGAKFSGNSSTYIGRVTDLGVPQRVRWIGHAVFLQNHGGFRFERDGDYYVEFDSMENTSWITRVLNGARVTMKVNKGILSHAFNGAGYAIQLRQNSELQIESPYIHTQHTLIQVRNSPRFILKCPDVRILDNYHTSSYGDQYKMFIDGHNGGGSYIEFEGSCINEHPVPSTSFGFADALIVMFNSNNAADKPIRKINNSVLINPVQPVFRSNFNNSAGYLELNNSKIFSGSSAIFSPKGNNAANQMNVIIKDSNIVTDESLVIGQGIHLQMSNSTIKMQGVDDIIRVNPNNPSVPLKITVFNSQVECTESASPALSFIDDPIVTEVELSNVLGNVGIGSGVVDKWTGYTEIPELEVLKIE